MKKLMIAAAAAAVSAGVLAANKAQVYDFTATLKTTGCRAAKVSRALANYFDHTSFGLSTLNGQYAQGDEIGIRKQVSVKIAGVIWGCDCPTISIPGWRPTDPTNPRYIGGFIFWNQQSETVYNPFLTDFDWLVLNRIDTMKKCEGSFYLKNTAEDQGLFLIGSGFGTVKDEGCDTYASSIKGNIAGIRFAPNDEFGCVFCAAEGCVVAPFCDTCYDYDTTAYSVANGTWTIKYNKSAAKKLSSTPFLSRIYKFKKAGPTQQVLNAIEQIWFRLATAAAADRDVIQPADADDEREWHGADSIEAEIDLLADVYEAAEGEEALSTFVEVLYPYVGVEEDTTLVEILADLS